jgi:lactobin A/cerein 7B family class IIb bacteriocin
MTEMNIFIDNCNLVALTGEELSATEGGVIPWGLIGRVSLRILVGSAGIATGTAIAIGTGLLAYEIYEALSD